MFATFAVTDGEIFGVIGSAGLNPQPGIPALNERTLTVRNDNKTPLEISDATQIQTQTLHNALRMQALLAFSTILLIFGLFNPIFRGAGRLAATLLLYRIVREPEFRAPRQPVVDENAALTDRFCCREGHEY